MSPGLLRTDRPDKPIGLIYRGVVMFDQACWALSPVRAARATDLAAAEEGWWSPVMAVSMPMARPLENVNDIWRDHASVVQGFRPVDDVPWEIHGITDPIARTAARKAFVESCA